MLTVHEVAARLGMSVSTVYDLARQRRTGHRRIGVGRGRLLFAEQDIQAYLDACKVEADSLPAGFRFTHSQ